MPKTSPNGSPESQLLKNLIRAVEQNTIVLLALQGVPQQKIRAVVGGDLNRVTKMLKHLKGHIRQ